MASEKRPEDDWWSDKVPVRSPESLSR